MKRNNTGSPKGIWKRIGRFFGRTLFLLLETVQIQLVILRSGEDLLVETLRNY